jgi:outer membrane biosynthesis protein TonB
MRRSMRALAVLLAAATLGLCSALLVACGDDRGGLIPPADAAAMNDALDRAEQELEADECQRAQQAVAEASQRSGELPATVDADLRTALADGLAHVADRVREECQRQQATTPTTPTVTETVPEPEPEPEPEPVPTTPEPEPTPTTPEPPPDSGGTPPGDGDGDGGGDGNGGSTPGDG